MRGTAAKRNENLMFGVLQFYRQHSALRKVKRAERSDWNLKNDAYKVSIGKREEVFSLKNQKQNREKERFCRYCRDELKVFETLPCR